MMFDMWGVAESGFDMSVDVDDKSVDDGLWMIGLWKIGLWRSVCG